MENKMRRAIRPDAQAFDEIHITTVPRFKDSEVSGSEWRISAKTEFYRKGKLIHDTYARDVETACRLLDHVYLTAIDEGKANFAGEEGVCDQEGCAKPAVAYLEQIEEGCDKCGSVKTPQYSRPYRQFCDTHKHRGDSSIDDNEGCYKPAILNN